MSEKVKDYSWKEILKAVTKSIQLYVILNFIVMTTVVAILLGIPNSYKSEAIYMPRSSDDTSASSGFAGLAQLVGGPTSSSRGVTSEALVTIRSKTFFEQALYNDYIISKLIAAEKFNIATKSYSYKSQIYKNGEFISFPTLTEAHGSFIKENFKASIDDEGFIKMSVTHISPYFAKELLELVVNELDIYLKNKHKQEHQNYLEFLTTQLNSTESIDVRRILAGMIQNELQKLLFTNNENYLFKIIDNPSFPEVKSSPDRFTYLVLSVLILNSLITFLILILAINGKYIALNLLTFKLSKIAKLENL
ncbi:hypothetical protein M9B39_04225 [SAR86 cluster bacterium]|nr:hypothetical protein M9B39_04225 [SAR86 cluster bacterium]